VNPPADGLRPAAAAVGGSRVRTAFLGSGAFAVPILRSLSEHPSIDLVGVVTAPPRPAGRRQALAATPVQRAADELGLGPVLTPERLRSAEGVLAVEGLGVDLLVLADYGRLVPAELLEPRHGALNLHPSLLPRHRGATPIPATILAGDPITGVTLMRMDAGLDTGPIVAQTRWALEGDETTPELEAALADEAAALLERSLDPWLAGELPALPQPSDGATLTRPLRREDARLDPDRPAAELERQVRAYDPWPGSDLELAGGRLKVWRAAVLPPRPGQEPRTLTVDDADGIALTTPRGRLQLLEVQPAGGRRMTGAAWRRGWRGRGSEGDVLERLP
jgi:methionyl-tRNA formyltransferase